MTRLRMLRFAAVPALLALGAAQAVQTARTADMPASVEGTTFTEAPLAAPPSRPLPALSAGERPQDPQASVRPLGVEAPGDASLSGNDAPVGTSSEGGRAPQNAEPALRLVYLGTLGLPETSLERIAADLAKLGLPYTIRGLPWKTVPVDVERTDVARRETTSPNPSTARRRPSTSIRVPSGPWKLRSRRTVFRGRSPCLCGS